MSAIWMAIILYSAAALFLGWWVSRKSDSGKAYWTASRQLNAGSVGLSISAGFMSVSWSCVYATQLFYLYGLGALWLITIPWLVTLYGIYLLARKYHVLNAFSQPEMVGQRFGVAMKRLVALSLSAVFLIWGGAEIYIAATLLAPGLGISIDQVIIGITLIVGTYTVIGGFRAVILTDKMQYVIVAAYIILMAVIAWQALATVSEPSLTVTAARSQVRWTSLLSPGIATIIITFIAYIPGWLFETDLWLRVQAARDLPSARRGIHIALLNAFLFVGVLPAFIGISAIYIFPHQSGIVPQIIGNEANQIFSALVSGFAPSWLAAIIAIGLVAAAMSTIDTCANVMGLSIAYDLLGIHKKKHNLQRSRLVSIAVMIGCGLFALHTESLWDLFYLSGGILTTSVALPVAAVVIKGIPRRAVSHASIAGLAGTILAYLCETRGWLALFQPEWLNRDGISFILWGLLAMVFGFLSGLISERRER